MDWHSHPPKSVDRLTDASLVVGVVSRLGGGSCGPTEAGWIALRARAVVISEATGRHKGTA